MYVVKPNRFLREFMCLGSLCVWSGSCTSCGSCVPKKYISFTSALFPPYFTLRSALLHAYFSLTSALLQPYVLPQVEVRLK